MTAKKRVITPIGMADRSKRSGLSETVDCLCAASRRAARSITRAFDRELRPMGLRAPQFSILAVLSLRGPTTIGELAKILSIERTTLTRNLALIEARGWIRIRPGDDARARIARITPKGTKTIVSAMPAWRAAQQDTIAALGEPGALALRKLARRAQA